MKKIKWILISVIFILVISSGIGIYAYFNGQFKIKQQNTQYEASKDAITIYNLDDFYQNIDTLTHTSIQAYLSSEPVSLQPVSLKWTENLKLIATKDLWITADCNIDFNGGELDLNGHHLYVRSYYSGQMVFANGTISNSKTDSVVQVEAPHGTVRFENIIWTNVNLPVETTIDSAIVYQNALEYAYQQIANYHGNGLMHLNQSATSEQTISSCHICSPADSDPCIYLLKESDLDLLKFYYDTPITYEFSDTKVVSEIGEVLSTGNTDLLIHVKDMTKKVHVHVVTEENKSYASMDVLLQYLNQFYSLEKALYEFNGDTILPTSNTYFNQNYQFKVYDDQDQWIESDSAYFEYPTTLKEFVILRLSTSVSYLGIVVNNKEIKIPVLGSSNGVRTDNYTYAKYIVYQNYGDGIIIEGKKQEDGSKIYSFDKNPNRNVLPRFEEDSNYASAPYQVTSVKYQILNDIDGVYEIVESESGFLLNIRDSKEPTAQIAYLDMQFTFNNGKNPTALSISIPIWYREVTGESGGGVGASSFRPYYLYFDREILTASEGYTYQNFEFPFTYNSNYPLYWVDYTLTNEDPNALTDEVRNNLFKIQFELTYNGKTDVYSDYESYKNAIEKLNMEDRKKLLATRPYFQAVINPNYIPLTNTTVTLSYRYNFIEDNNGWVEYNEGTTSFVICGIVRNEATTAGIPDANLYSIIQNAYAKSTEEYIIYDWLSAEMDTLSFEGRTDITSYQGLQYLTGLKNLNMKNCGISSYSVAQFGTLAQYISQMVKLESLDLSNNNIKDRNSNSTTGTPTGTDNEFVRKLGVLANLSVLHLENNKIYQFKGLNEFESLTEVFVHGNSFTGRTILGIDLAELVGTNDIYGSVGEINTAYYIQAYTSHNMKIWWKSNEIYQPSASQSKFSSLMSALSNLEYQEKIPVNTDISMVYNALSTDPSDYSDVTLSNSLGDYIGKDSVKFEAVLAEGMTNETTTQFRIVYTYRHYYDQGSITQDIQYVDIEIDMVYDVERVAF